jgi:hypothetical protein
MNERIKNFLTKNIEGIYNIETIRNYREIFQFYTLLYDFAYSEIKQYIKDTISYNMDEEEDVDQILTTWIRNNYLNGDMPLPGDEIILYKMYDDPHPIEPGTKGIVLNYTYVNIFNEEHIDVAWENGRKLKLIVGLDDYKKI